MSSAALLALSPHLTLTALIVVVMLAVAFRRSHRLAFGLTAGGLAACLACLPLALGPAPVAATALIVVDGFALLFTALVLGAALAVAALYYPYARERAGRHEELYLLLLTATLGALVLVASTHLASLFLGLEILSVSLFALIGYPRGRPRPLEAAVKYLILSGASSAFLLLGMALVYAEQGTLELAGLLVASGSARPELIVAGAALIAAGLGFKLSLVPFHLWTPDVYEGAPAPVTAFLATVSKGAVFALLLRLLPSAGGHGHASLILGIAVIAVASMLLGNVLALRQDNVKRLLGYSSIAHLGYLLVALLAGGAFGTEAAAYALAAYFVATLGAFGVVAVHSAATGEAESRDAYRGLFWERPWLAGVLTLMLLSLAGIPLTMGFVGKFYLFAAGVGTALWAPLAALVAGSAIGLFYYLRLIIVLYQPERGGRAFAPVPVSGRLVLAGLTAALVWLGVYPAPLVAVIQGAAAAGAS